MPHSRWRLARSVEYLPAAEAFIRRLNDELMSGNELATALQPLVMHIMCAFEHGRSASSLFETPPELIDALLATQGDAEIDFAVANDRVHVGVMAWYWNNRRHTIVKDLDYYSGQGTPPDGGEPCLIPAAGQNQKPVIVRFRIAVASQKMAA